MSTMLELPTTEKPSEETLQDALALLEEARRMIARLDIALNIQTMPDVLDTGVIAVPHAVSKQEEGAPSK